MKIIDLLEQITDPFDIPEMGQRTLADEYSALQKKIKSYDYNLKRLSDKLDGLIDGLTNGKDYSHDSWILRKAGVPLSEIIEVPPIAERYLHSGIMFYDRRSIRNPRAFEVLVRTMAQILSRKQTVEQQLKRVTTVLNKERQAAADARRTNVITQMISPANVPTKISTGKSAFVNPYHAGNNSQYAGHPDGYTLSSSQLAIYDELKQIFDRNGVAGFRVCYAARVGKFINFAFIGVNDKFIWRKYDVGGGSGQNWIYIDGNKMKTTDFLSLPPAKQDALIKAL